MCHIPVFNQSENSVDGDRMALSEASLSGSTVFSKKINPGSAGQELSVLKINIYAIMQLNCSRN